MSSTDPRLLLAVDAGNTQTVVGVFDGEELLKQVRLSSDRERTADELAAILFPLLEREGWTATDVGDVVISSVVPPLNPVLDTLCRRYFDIEPLFVEPGIRTGLPVRYDNPTEVGADRIVNALAARELYGSPVVVVDFGTATTFDVVNERGEYIGGLIAPGLGISAEALFSRASRLHRVDIRAPSRLIGKNTAEAMQAGLFYGYVGLVEGILERLTREITSLRKVIATGGLAELIAGGTPCIDEVVEHLTLVGLRRIHELNRGPGRRH